MTYLWDCSPISFAHDNAFLGLSDRGKSGPTSVGQLMGVREHLVAGFSHKERSRIQTVMNTERDKLSARQDRMFSHPSPAAFYAARARAAMNEFDKSFSQIKETYSTEAEAAIAEFDNELSTTDVTISSTRTVNPESLELLPQSKRDSSHTVPVTATIAPFEQECDAAKNKASIPGFDKNPPNGTCLTTRNTNQLLAEQRSPSLTTHNIPLTAGHNLLSTVIGNGPDATTGGVSSSGAPKDLPVATQNHSQLTSPSGRLATCPTRVFRFVQTSSRYCGLKNSLDPSPGSAAKAVQTKKLADFYLRTMKIGKRATNSAKVRRRMAFWPIIWDFIFNQDSFFWTTYSKLERIGKRAESLLQSLLDEIEALVSRLCLHFYRIAALYDYDFQKVISSFRKPVLEFHGNRRYLCTTMPWVIWPALVVLWGVCWMFYSGFATSQGWETQGFSGSAPSGSAIPEQQQRFDSFSGQPGKLLLLSPYPLFRC